MFKQIAWVDLVLVDVFVRGVNCHGLGLACGRGFGLNLRWGFWLRLFALEATRDGRLGLGGGFRLREDELHLII